MELWYMHRSGQQYGPYTTDQLIQMYNNRQLIASDLFFKNNGQNRMKLKKALRIWQAQNTLAPQYKNGPGRKKKPGCLIFLLIMVLIIAGTFTVFSLTQNADLIRTGKSTLLVTEKIDKKGGTMTIDNSGSELNGLSLFIPEGAYEKTLSFRVSTRPVEDHNLGEQIDFLTPLITIDNGHGFSLEPMLLTVPIKLKAGQFAMGFYYNRKTGMLEGIPFTELTEDHITLVTRHFSDLVVLATDLRTLTDMKVDTGYRPGADDWQFVNKGSAIAPGGHCAGQSLTSMFYYTDIHLAQKQPRLFGRFDNNRYGAKTTGFQDDDSWGYRFASVVQTEMAWNTYSLSLQQTIGKANDLYSLAAFAFAMKLTGEPQFVYIAGQTNIANRQTYAYAHAIIAYRIEEGKIYVADPNYPGQSDRTINFAQTGSFSPYGSGANADDITANGVLPFTQVRYLAKTSLIDYSRLHEQYKSMQKGVIGNDIFPTYLIEYLKAVDPESGEETWVELKEDLELNGEDTEKAGENMRGKLKIRISNTDEKSMQYTPCTGLSPVRTSRSWTINTGGNHSTTYTLKEGATHLGFKIEHQVSGGYKYTDFVRVQVVYEKQADLALKRQYRVINQMPVVYTVQVKDAPAEPEYSWDFGDDKDPLITKEPSIRFAYVEPGDYTLTVSLIDATTGKTLASTYAPVESYDLFGTWDLEYTIESSGLLDELVTSIVKGFSRFFAEIFQTQIDEDIEVTMKGTVIGCEMVVLPPDTENPQGRIRVRLQQLTSNNDFVEPTDDIWTGYLTLKGDDQFVITITAEEQPVGITFKGILDGNEMAGEINAVLFKGSFVAFR